MIAPLLRSPFLRSLSQKAVTEADCKQLMKVRLSKEWGVGKANSPQVSLAFSLSPFPLPLSGLVSACAQNIEQPLLHAIAHRLIRIFRFYELAAGMAVNFI